MLSNLLLNDIEIRFIKDFAYGKPLREIKKHICIDCDKKLMLFKRNIHKKLSIDCDFCLIHKCYKESLFNIDDHFLKTQQHIAFGTAYNIYMLKQNECMYMSFTIKELYVKVLRVHVEIINSYKSKIKSLTG